MSKRGAEGILAARAAEKAKTPEGVAALPDVTKPKPVRGTARSMVTDQDVKQKLKDAEEPKEESQSGEKVGEAIGLKAGRGIGSTLSMGNEAAGFVLGLLVWGWFVRPFLSGGAQGVKAMLMAKFFNKKLDGTELP